MTNDILANLARWVQQNPEANAGDHAGQELLDLVRSIRADRGEKQDSQHTHEIRNRIAADLATILAQAEKHGTLARLKSVAIYFDEMELRTIVKSLHGPT